MHTFSRKAATRHTTVALSLVAALFTAAPAAAENMEMPNAAEVQYFSPEAQQFYAAGVAAIDRADYSNAYNMLAKAGALQPASVRLNHIVAQLAMYHGRQTKADEAKDFYQTAIASYESILNVPTITADLRIKITNQLKIALQEAAELDQRDAIREATGTTFILDYNRRYATQTPRAAGILEEMASVTTRTVEANPVADMMAQQATMDGGMGIGMGMEGMGMMPGDPGMGMMPGDPNMGMNPADPTMQPPQPGFPADPAAPGAMPQNPGPPANPNF